MTKQTTINDVFKFHRFRGFPAAKRPEGPPRLRRLIDPDLSRGSAADDDPARLELAEHLLPTARRPPPWGRTGTVASVGIADLMVVKQHILRYEATEIAHIENVMASETRARHHRFLERLEETITLEREVTDTREAELETSERFELNKETAQTIKEDQKFGFDLNVSAKYGPMVEVESGFEFDSEASRESTAKSSSHYAKNVTDRSLQRIEQRVREERIRKLIRETEETNRHEFSNTDGEHIVGIYQFVDKIYQAQVFNYGKRQMFDLFVPEPASFLWHLERHPQPEATAAVVPPPPPPLTIRPTDLTPTPDRPGAFFADLVARYRATGVPAPRQPTVIVSQSREYPLANESGANPSSVGDPGSPRFVDHIKVRIPEGYVPVSAKLTLIASSDAPDAINVHFAYEENVGRWVGTDDATGSHPVVRAARLSLPLSGAGTYATESEGAMIFNVHLFDVSFWSATAHVTCELGEEELRKWQLATYDAIQVAYFDRLKEWQSEVDRLGTAAAATLARSTPVGTPPATRLSTIVTELKKHCISILSGYWYDDPTVMIDRGEAPPAFDLVRAELYGRAVRLFEQAFEWHQMQYAFYPYYWASPESWAERLRRGDPDYQYQQFLQAGAARVVVPVRPGFEHVVNAYLEGRGEVPDPAFLAIAAELKEQSGEELDTPVPVGEPWEIRIPTSLIRLKTEAPTAFPSWRKVDGEDWTWRPEDSGT